MTFETFEQSDEGTWTDWKRPTYLPTGCFFSENLKIFRKSQKFPKISKYSENLCYLTINCDTGQHSQFLRCFYQEHPLWCCKEEISWTPFLPFLANLPMGICIVVMCPASSSFFLVEKSDKCEEEKKSVLQVSSWSAWEGFPWKGGWDVCSVHFFLRNIFLWKTRIWWPINCVCRGNRCFSNELTENERDYIYPWC